MSFDINRLRTFAANNDRVGYWNYLGQFDNYGRLAAGVATNETTSGYVANRYFSGIYEEKTGAPPTADQLRNIGSDLMRRDLVARESNIQDSITELR